MNAVVIAPIVEGHGEFRAAPELLRRVASAYAGPDYVVIAQPFRLDSAKMRKPDELARALMVQAKRVPDRGGVLVLRDGDDKDMTCPVDLAKAMAPNPSLVRVPVEIVIARHEYEAWFLAAAESLRSHAAVRDDAEPPEDPEGMRDAKGALRAIMNESYRETLHQAKFSAVMDLEAAEQRSRSFRRLINAVRLLTR